VSFLDAHTAYGYLTNDIPSQIKNPQAVAKAELTYWAEVADQL